MMAGSLKAVDVLAHLQRNKVAQRLARSGNRGAGGSREPAYCLGLRARGPSQRAMSMSATANVFGDGLFNLSVDVVPRINRSLETGIFFWRRIFSGRAGADGGLLPENRRQRIVENPSRSMRLRSKLTPFFVWLSSARVARRGLLSNEHVDRALCRLKRLFVDVLKGGD